MTRLTFFMGLCLLASCGDSTGATGGAGGVGGTSGAGGSGGIDLDVWSCTEQGIRDAITFGGGPHTFDCDGPTIVTTEATIEIDNDVILDGEGSLTVDGDQSHGVFIVQRSIRAELRNLVVTRGRTVFVGSSTAGAGIRNRGDLRIDGCSVVENESDGIPGGVSNQDGSLEIRNSVISRNDGGGVILGDGSVVIEDSSISENLGPGIENFGRLTIWRTTIAANVSTFGGGGIYNSGDLIVGSSIISANEASTGGGVFNSGSLSIFGTSVEGNTAEEGGGVYGYDASRFGGDLWLYRLGVIELAGSTISNNTAQRGAGIYSLSLRMTAWNNTLSGNTASQEGGALYVGGTTLGASTTYLTQNTIVDNTAPVGSALVASGDAPTVRFSGNVVSGGCIAQGNAVVFESQGYNIESPGESCGLIESSDEPNTTSEQLSLGTLQDNGGETETHLPATDSIAINLIPVGECANVLPVEPGFDQRSVERPQGTGCDAGSVEVVPEP